MIVRQFAAKLAAEAREIAPPEVAAALRPLEDRLAAIERCPQGASSRLHLVRGRPEGPDHAHSQARETLTGEPRPRSPGCRPCLRAKQPDQPRPTARSTGRRLWLARWLTGRENPLVARVIANRVWQFHFGRGLVASSNDLGVMGEAPTHPELLDWLAAEAIASGWRLKPLHRLIVLSQTYQRSSVFPAEAATARPGKHDARAVPAAPSRGRSRS